MQRERQAGELTSAQTLAAMEQQKAGSVAHNIIHRERQFLETLQFANGPICNRCSETAALHHPRCFRSGCGRQLQRLRQVGCQPAAALRQCLGVRQHLRDALNRTTTEQGVADRQNQSASNAQIGMRPESVKTGRDTTLHRVLNGHHSSLTTTIRHVVDH